MDNGARDYGPDSWAFRLRPRSSRTDLLRFGYVVEGLRGALREDPRVLERVAGWRSGVTATFPSVGEAEIEQACLFVRDELGLPWPWVAYDLLLSYAPGAESLSLWPRQIVIPPPVTVHSEQVPGETIAEARDRIIIACGEALARLDAVERRLLGRGRRGKAPKNDGEHLRDWGRWFYEVRVRKHRSVSAVARSLLAHRNHVGADLLDCGCRNAVRDGVEEARRLLSLAACTWKTLEGMRPPA
jgi:hypothetical protein